MRTYLPVKLGRENKVAVDEARRGQQNDRVDDGVDRGAL